MTVVVGYTPSKGGRGSLDLGLQLAHALGEDLTVVTVVPRQWATPSMARVDAEFGEYARQVGEESERQARDYLSETTVSVDVTYRVVPGRSIAHALVGAVEETDASVLVLGSSADGQVGRVVVGSTADKLLHASPVPLAISPREFRSTAADGVTKVTAAFSDSESSVRVVGRVATLAGRFGVPLRVASFGVRGATMYPPVTGITAEDSVLSSWSEQARAAQERLVRDGVVPGSAELVIATGATWGDTMASVPWEPGEVLALGSSSMGPVARVFLGSRATKLIRHAPVPVIVLPHEG
ncbi:universal stress protein [Microlunatus flavus]|uniref:Nucleotide-binding universal stress protein, UspA family n=1 Tax=Microlunatus flavus TaxID=1036181 RepID=A0A1H9I4P2_9ACTN|nr:universal stress protein [Microlunatus flavus]SEQ69560.1 Nucleotide-binding universal stress protein, UspA family [Microlunatus flavus]